jgi:arsenite-transporting ATPase
MISLERFLVTQSDLKFIFTGGKGGVGKTTAAVGLAYHFASQGKKTLVASLNPVHSLSSIFDRDLTDGRTKEITDNLYAVEVETQEIVERYRRNITQRVKDFLKWADIPVRAGPFIDIAVTNPAFEESAMFDKMTDIMLTEGEEYDVLVFDTAAVANAVRLIGLSKIYGLWLSRMIESRKEALSLRVQLSFRKEKMMEEVKKDPLMADLLSMNERFKEVKKLLVDPKRTAFFFITLPLALPIAVVKRFIRMVRAYDIPIGGVIVNQVLQKEVAEASKADEYLQNKYKEQFGYMSTIKRDLSELVRAFIPLYPQEVASLDMVARVSYDLFSYVPAFWGEL